MKMKKSDFLKVANRKYEVDRHTIQYSDQPNYEWYAVVNGKLVDVSGYEWEDFDGFVEAVIEEYQKGRKYNGWKNYETWLFNLHYGDYLYEAYQDLKESDPVEFVENFIESLFIDGLPSSTPRFFLDVVRACIERVDVEEIAEHLLED